MTLLTMARYEWFQEWEGTKLGKRGRDYLDLKTSMAQELLDWALTIFPQLRDKVCINVYKHGVMRYFTYIFEFL